MSRLSNSTFYAAVQGDVVPESHEWSDNLISVKEEAYQTAMYNPGEDSVVVYEITLKPLYETVLTITLEEV